MNNEIAIQKVLGNSAPQNADFIEWLKRVIYYRKLAEQQNVSLVEYGVKTLAKYAGLKLDVPVPLPYGFYTIINLRFQPEALSNNKNELSDIRWLMQNGGCLIGKLYHTSGNTYLGSTVTTFGVNSTVTFVKLEASKQILEKLLARIGAFTSFIASGGIVSTFIIRLMFGNLVNLTNVVGWSDLNNTVKNLKIEQRRYIEWRNQVNKGTLNTIYHKVQDAGAQTLGKTVETVTLGKVNSSAIKAKIYKYN